MKVYKPQRKRKATSDPPLNMRFLPDYMLITVASLPLKALSQLEMKTPSFCRGSPSCRGLQKWPRQRVSKVCVNQTSHRPVLFVKKCKGRCWQIQVMWDPLSWDSEGSCSCFLPQNHCKWHHRQGSISFWFLGWFREYEKPKRKKITEEDAKIKVGAGIPGHGEKSARAVQADLRKSPGLREDCLLLLNIWSPRTSSWYLVTHGGFPGESGECLLDIQSQYWGEQWEGVSVPWAPVNGDLEGMEIHMQCRRWGLHSMKLRHRLHFAWKVSYWQDPDFR